ncbi:hypothetical protein BT63DRAFT_58465 [Microthyrium microscopicum]|uniref:Uncharacterized protein n=1 Tax=Microthyrium microscopicum TaxID=703497 RepID=A0A6A6U453_9PEZI|nr:hypothetical protein BT63DRAFT_58465 [Microthyrium microscopicum]
MTTSSPIGVNITEILTGIRKSKYIYDTYYDPYERANGRLQSLVSTSKDLHDVLQESERLLRLWNRHYPGQTSLNRRLQETHAFIRRFCDLEQLSQEDASFSPPRRKQSWKLFRYGWEERRAMQIHEGLMMELHKFIQFILVVALRATVTPPGSTPSNRISGRLKPEDSTIEDIARRLNEIHYQVERLQNQAILVQFGRGRDLDLTDLEQQLEREWRLLCLRAGFEDVAHRPPLPGGSRNLLLSPSQVYTEIIIAHNRDSLIGPRHEGLNLTPFAPENISSKRSRTLSPDPATTVPLSPNIEPDQHHILLGDPALPICIAS